jgi:hypothetical protein
MRLGPGRGAAMRQDRFFQLHCERAAAPKLRAMFPAVEQLRFELSFEGGGTSTPVPQSHVLHPPARAYFSFPCPYGDCDGRFELTAAVHAAVEDPSHRIEGMLECAGLRARDFASKRPCQLRLHFTLTAMCPPAH